MAVDRYLSEIYSSLEYNFRVNYVDVNEPATPRLMRSVFSARARWLDEIAQDFPDSQTKILEIKDALAIGEQSRMAYPYRMTLLKAWPFSDTNIQSRALLTDLHFARTSQRPGVLTEERGMDFREGEQIRREIKFCDLGRIKQSNKFNFAMSVDFYEIIYALYDGSLKTNRQITTPFQPNLAERLAINLGDIFTRLKIIGN